MNSNEVRRLKDVLIDKISKSSNVFIVGHNSPDFDSIGSSIGLFVLARSLNKRAYIIVDDDDFLIEPGVKRIIDESKYKFSYIKKSDFLRLVNNNSLLIVSDVNKKNMISVGDDLDKVRDVIVIDHHSTNSDTIDTPYSFISENVSSASEIVTRVLWVCHLKYSRDVSNYLLAGISLDTHRFMQNTTSRTHDVAEKLIDKGADIDYVNSLFLEEFERYCRVNNLVINGTLIKNYSDSLLAQVQISFTLDRDNPKAIYLKEDYAKAADVMMQFQGIDASFALGYVSGDAVHISARGGKKVNVGKIMDMMSGGGNSQRAGARIVDAELLSVEEELMNKVFFGLEDDEIIIDEIPKEVGKQFKRIRKK